MVDVVLFLFNTDDGRCSYLIKMMVVVLFLFKMMVDVVLFLFNKDDGRCSLVLIYTDDGR